MDIQPNWINIPPYNQDYEYAYWEDFHAVYTVSLGELIHDGLVKFDDGTWYQQPNGLPIAWYDDEQRDRFWAKFGQYYFYREIGELPYKRWKDDLLAKIALLMPKYNLLYKALAKNSDPLQEYDEYGKSRNIFSDFPQTMLSGNEDYASTGNDSQFERIRQGSFVEKMNALVYDYNDVDFALLQELDSHFYCVLTSNMNGY